MSNELDRLADTAQEGLEQIENKGYSAKLRDYSYVQRILQICMAFCGKEGSVGVQTSSGLAASKHVWIRRGNVVTYPASVLSMVAKSPHDVTNYTEMLRCAQHDKKQHPLPC